MLTYELLKIWYNIVTALPDAFCWAVVGIVALVYIIFKKDKNYGAAVSGLIAVALGPLLMYGICCLLVSLRSIPLIGICCIIIQLAIDASIIAGIVILIRAGLKK